MTRAFLDRPTGRLIFINGCIGLGLLVAYRNGYRGLDLFSTYRSYSSFS